MLNNKSVKIFIIHNNEEERLLYLSKKIPDLLEYFNNNSITAEVNYIGPDISSIKNNKFFDTFILRLTRQFYITKINFFMDFHNPTRSKKIFIFFQHLIRFLKSIRKLQKDGVRSIIPEQENLQAHIYALHSIRHFSGFGIVLESDAIFLNQSGKNLIDLFSHLEGLVDRKSLYCDLAGGCDRKEILNSWAFENEHILRNIQINSNLEAHILPTLVNNTAGGYLINSAFAEQFFDFLTTKKYMLPIDFAFNLFACEKSRFIDFICIHTTPTIFEQGSSIGRYSSSSTFFKKEKLS